MKQALHIFKKDVRCLRYEIVIVLFFVAAFTVSAIRFSLSEGYIDLLTGFLLPLGLPLVAWYLIVRVIHAEALPGDRQFWITRPYRWQSLLGAKALFVLAFLNLPIVIADSVILNANGFSLLKELPGLITEQVLITAALFLPMVALAAVTTGLVQVLLAVLIFAAIAITRSLLVFRAPLSRPVDWVGATVAVVGIASVAAAVVLWQYSRRRTVPARVIAGGGFVAVCALSAIVPFSFSFWIQSLVSNRVDASAIQISVDARDPWFAHRVSLLDDHVVVQAPIRVRGIPAGMVLRPDALIVTLEAPDGTVKLFDSGPWSPEEGLGPSHWPRILLGGRFFEKIKDQPVRLYGSAFATLFGNQRQTPIPYDAKRLAVAGAGLCDASRTETLTRVTCRYPFRIAPDAVTIFFGQTGEDTGQLLSYSPFPAQLGSSPVNLLNDFVRKAIPGPPVVVTAEPLAHLRRDFEIKNLRLSEAH